MATDFCTCVKYDIIEDHALGRKRSINSTKYTSTHLAHVLIVTLQDWFRKTSERYRHSRIA